MYGPEYPKIPALWRRQSERPHKVMVGEFTSHEIEFLSELEWLGYEKIDGTNIRIHWDGHRVRFNGRTDNAQVPTGLIELLGDRYGTEEFEQVIEGLFGDTPVTIYGEGFGAGIQKGGRYSPDKQFHAFDVLVGETSWSDPQQLAEVLKQLDIPAAPVMAEGKLLELADAVALEPVSPVAAACGGGTDTTVEGLVARPAVPLCDRYGKRILVKLKVKDLL